MLQVTLNSLMHVQDFQVNALFDAALGSQNTSCIVTGMGKSGWKDYQ